MGDIAQEVDGSLWVRDGTAHGRLAEAPASAPVLRARARARFEDLEPALEPWHPDPDPDVGQASTRAAWHPPADHPWRKGYDRRRRIEG